MNQSIKLLILRNSNTKKKKGIKNKEKKRNKKNREKRKKDLT